MLEKGILCKRFRLCIIGGLHVTSSVIWKKEQVYFEGFRRLNMFYVMVAEGMIPTIRNQIALIPLVGAQQNILNQHSIHKMHTQSIKKAITPKEDNKILYGIAYIHGRWTLLTFFASCCMTHCIYKFFPPYPLRKPSTNQSQLRNLIGTNSSSWRTQIKRFD